MSVDLSQIEAIRTQAIAQMQTLLANEAPTITVNDEEVAWAPLLASLERTIDWCDRKLGEYDPYEVRSRGET
jgi:protein-disulfide isomerase